MRLRVESVEGFDLLVFCHFRFLSGPMALGCLYYRAGVGGASSAKKRGSFPLPAVDGGERLVERDAVLFRIPMYLAVVSVGARAERALVSRVA